VAGCRGGGTSPKLTKETYLGQPPQSAYSEHKMEQLWSPG